VCCFPQGPFLPGLCGAGTCRICSSAQLGTCSHRSAALVKVWSPGHRFSALGATLSADRQGLCSPWWVMPGTPCGLAAGVQARRSRAPCLTLRNLSQGSEPETAGRECGFETQGQTRLHTRQKRIHKHTPPPSPSLCTRLLPLQPDSFPLAHPWVMRW